MNLESPLSESAAIVVVGVRNAGKSSLINALFGKDVAIVSAEPGTTTDPVTRKMELPGWGPVAFVDTAGIDDDGELGLKRVAKTEERLASCSAAVFATPGHRSPIPAETTLLERLRTCGKPFLVALTHADLPLDPEKARAFGLPESGAKGSVPPFAVPVKRVDGRSGAGAAELRTAIAALADGGVVEPGPLEGVAREGDHFLLVAPIDLAAPKGRLIQPQTETIRDALDRDCMVTVVKERELYDAYRSFKARPRLVITDSQAFSKVAADIPEDQPLTSFSILFARKKGELDAFLSGLDALSRFPVDGRVFVMEACSHHRGADDIASVKIPRLFSRMVTPTARLETVRKIPDDLCASDLVIHCAACMMTGNSLKARMEKFRAAGVPVTNYGLFMAWANGLLPRAIEPFPEFAGVRKEALSREL